MTRKEHRRGPGFVVLIVVLIALSLVPFLIFGSASEAFVEHVFGADRSSLAYGGAATLLLAGDAVLPVPSSVVATLAGMRIGFLPAALANGLGLSLGGVFGLALGHGARAALPGLPRTLPSGFEAWIVRHGLVALLVCRPIPVLAEASLVIAGVAGLRLRFLLAWLIPAQICLGTLYAAAGALERSSPVPGPALVAGSIGVPLAFAIAAWFMARSERQEPSSACGQG